MLCCLFFAYLTIDPLRASEGYAWDSWQPPFKVWLGFNGGLDIDIQIIEDYFDVVLVVGFDANIFDSNHRRSCILRKLTIELS